MARRLGDAPAAGGASWRDASAPLATRVRALLDQLTTDEKIGQLDATTHPTGGVDRLGVPAFQGWNGASAGRNNTSSSRLSREELPHSATSTAWLCELLGLYSSLYVGASSTHATQSAIRKQHT